MNMFKSSKLLFVFFIFVSLLCASSKKITKLVGDDIIKTIKNSKNATLYKVGSRENAKVKNISGFPILNKGELLASAELKTLKSILLDDDSYDFEGQKRCAFSPSKAVVFGRGSKKVSVLFCFTCKELQFESSDVSKIEDFDRVAQQLKLLL